MHRGDKNRSAVRIGDFETHATVSRCCPWQLVRTANDLREQGSQIREFNAIRIFYNAKVIADVEIVDAHQIAALLPRTNRAHL